MRENLGLQVPLAGPGRSGKAGDGYEERLSAGNFMSRSTAVAILRTLAGAGTLSERLTFSWIILASRMKVISGPFSGMNYVPQSAGSAYYPKLLGIYEKELANVIEAVIQRAPDLIVDAGSAEGYFAVGFAMRCPRAKVVAYDMDIRACYFLQMLAEGNRLRERIEIHCKPCTCSDLTFHLEGASRPFLLMDVEGAERVLLDPEEVSSLKSAEILVEVHEFPGEPPLAGLLASRFAPTHRVAEISAQNRSVSDLPVSPGLFPKAAEAALNEGREMDQKWLHFVPHDW